MLSRAREAIIAPIPTAPAPKFMTALIIQITAATKLKAERKFVIGGFLSD
jgi:hypothetical protein